MPVSLASSDAFHAIADPTRRIMLERLLPDGLERSAGQLGAGFELSQPTLSQHLRVLRDAGLVQARQEGRHRLYRLQLEPLEPVRSWVGEMVSFTDPSGHVWTIRPNPQED